MKPLPRPFSRILLLLIASSLLPALQAQEGEASASAEAENAVLQVRIDVPPAWDPWLSDDLAEALFNRVRHVFLRRGFEAELREVRRLREPEAGRPTLDLRLFRWEVERSGSVRCTIRAELTSTEGEETELGIYHATEFTWGTRNRWELAHAFRDAADDVAQQLWRDIQEEGLLPDMMPSENKQED